MDLNYLRKILKIFDQSSLTDLTIEENGLKISLSRKVEIVAQQPQPLVVPEQRSILIEQQISPSEPIAKTNEQVKETTAVTYHKINSPIVGTFYRSSSPEADPFVEVGSHVVPGQTVCIVEAMKVMNEIVSDVAGTVVEILVENGKPVEYNQTLMLIKPD